MNGLDHVAKLYGFCRQQGYKVTNFNTEARCNDRGAYEYVTLSLLVPVSEPTNDGAEAQKDKEVINHEI